MILVYRKQYSNSVFNEVFFLNISARDLFFTKRLYFSNAPQLTRKQPALLQTSSRNGAISLSNKVVLDFFLECS